MNHLPSVTVITVVFNAEALVERTMRSIRAQTLPDVRQVIVDGLSTDRTLEKVRQFEHAGMKIISEKDKGLYDAMNKGIAHADGDYLLFLNAGDELFAPDTLERMMKAGDGADFIYGDTVIVNELGQELSKRRLRPPAHLNWKSLRMGMVVSHQSILVRREICVEYNLSYRISADIDWTIRCLKKAKRTHFYEGITSRFLEGGVSSSRRWDGLKERLRIQLHHYGMISTLIAHFFITLRFFWHLLTRKNFT